MHLIYNTAQLGHVKIRATVGRHGHRLFFFFINFHYVAQAGGRPPCRHAMALPGRIALPLKREQLYLRAASWGPWGRGCCCSVLRFGCWQRSLRIADPNHPRQSGRCSPQDRQERLERSQNVVNRCHFVLKRSVLCARSQTRPGTSCRPSGSSSALAHCRCDIPHLPPCHRPKRRPRRRRSG